MSDTACGSTVLQAVWLPSWYESYLVSFSNLVSVLIQGSKSFCETRVLLQLVSRHWNPGHKISSEEAVTCYVF